MSLEHSPSRGRVRRFLRRREVQEVLGIGHSHLYALIADKQLPPPFEVSPRVVAWSEDDIVEFQQRCMERRGVRPRVGIPKNAPAPIAPKRSRKA